MQLVELLFRVHHSERRDWQATRTPSPHDGPHRYRAVLVHDVSIALAWGMADPDEGPGRWAALLPGEDVRPELVDILYHGALVTRRERGVVDDGRCGLPLPRAVQSGSEARLAVDRPSYALYRTINGLEVPDGGEELFDRGVQRRRILLID